MSKILRVFCELLVLGFYWYLRVLIVMFGLHSLNVMPRFCFLFLQLTIRFTIHARTIHGIGWRMVVIILGAFICFWLIVINFEVGLLNWHNSCIPSFHGCSQLTDASFLRSLQFVYTYISLVPLSYGDWIFLSKFSLIFVALFMSIHMREYKHNMVDRPSNHSATLGDSNHVMLEK